MPTPLIVIDMQRRFKAARSNKLLSAVRFEVRQTIQQQASILFLEYSPKEKYLKTRPNLIRTVKGHSYTVLAKETDDGSRQVLEFLSKSKETVTEVRLCGVNTCACVCSTMIGLASQRKDLKIEIALNSCGCICSTNSQFCENNLNYWIKHYNFQNVHLRK